MTTTTRSIGEVLTIRRRAAELRVLECAAGALQVQLAIQQAVYATPKQVADLEKAVEAKRVAEAALGLARQEVDSEAGEPVEPVPYEPATSAALRRYAAVLLLDNPEMSLTEAHTAAARDQELRFADYHARYVEHDLEDLDDDQV